MDATSPSLAKKPRSTCTVTVIEMNQPDPEIFGKALHEFMKGHAADRRALAVAAEEKVA